MPDFGKKDKRSKATEEYYEPPLAQLSPCPGRKKKVLHRSLIRTKGPAGPNLAQHLVSKTGQPDGQAGTCPLLLLAFQTMIIRARLLQDIEVLIQDVINK